jgi:hypothetical protein
MGTTYVSYCEKCKLAIDDGKDGFKLRHEMFKLYHNHRYPDHDIERYNDDSWVDKQIDNVDWPEQLYDEQTGYLINIPDWLDDIIEEKVESWIKNESMKGNELQRFQVTWDTEEDIIRTTIEENRDKLLAEELNLFEYRLKIVLTRNKQYKESHIRRIELLPDKSFQIQTGHGEIIITDGVKDVVVYAVRDYKRKWIATLQDDKILKYGTEESPKGDN